MFINKRSDEENRLMKRFESALSLSDTDPTLFRDLFGVPGAEKVDVKKQTFRPNELLPSQTTIQIELAVDIAIAVLMRDEDVGDLNSIISCNNYIMDGHHRWVGMTLAWGKKAKIIGHQAELPAEDLIRVLNIITKSVLGKTKGNPGTGSIKDITPKNVRSVLQKFLRQGTRFGKFSKTPEEVRNALIKHFGTIENGVKQISNNARHLSVQVPSWAPSRSNMPVINEDEVSLTESLLEQGWLTDRTKLKTLRKGSSMNILRKLEMRIARLEKVSARRKEKGFSAKEHYASQKRYASKGLKSVQVFLPEASDRQANHFLHALSGEIVDGDIIRSQVKKIEGELDVNFQTSLHPSSPSYPEAETINSTSGVRSKLIISVDIKKLERSAKIPLSSLSNLSNKHYRSKALRLLCDSLSKNIDNNILRNMTDDQINIAFNYAQDEIEDDLPMYYSVSDIEVVEYDYFVTDLVLKNNDLEITVETRIEYDVLVDFDQKQSEEDYY